MDTINNQSPCQLWSWQLRCSSADWYAVWGIEVMSVWTTTYSHLWTRQLKIQSCPQEAGRVVKSRKCTHVCTCTMSYTCTCMHGQADITWCTPTPHDLVYTHTTRPGVYTHTTWPGVYTHTHSHLVAEVHSEPVPWPVQHYHSSHPLSFTSTDTLTHTHKASLQRE